MTLVRSLQAEVLADLPEKMVLVVGPGGYQVVKDGRRDVVDNGVRCVPAATFLGALA